MLKSLCYLTQIFKTGIWLGGSTTANQPEAMLEYPFLTNMDFYMDFMLPGHI